MLLKWETFPVSRRAVLCSGVYSALRLMTHWPSIILLIVQPRLHVFPSVCRKPFVRWCLPVLCHVFILWFTDFFWFLCWQFFFAFQTAPTSRNLSHLIFYLCFFFFLESTIRVAHLWASRCSGHLFWLSEQHNNAQHRQRTVLHFAFIAVLSFPKWLCGLVYGWGRSLVPSAPTHFLVMINFPLGILKNFVCFPTFLILHILLKHSVR